MLLIRILWLGATYLVVIPGIAWADYVSGPAVSLAGFYIIPIAACAWWFGSRLSSVAALESALLNAVADMAWNVEFDLAILTWNTLARGIVFVLVALFVARQRAESFDRRAELDTARDDLARSHERLNLLMQGIRGYSIMMLDTTGHIVMCSEQGLRSLGASAQQVIGEPFWRFYPESVIQEGEPERWLERAAAEGSWHASLWQVGPDGTRVYVTELIEPLRDAEGNLRGFSKVTRDLTQQMEREREARAFPRRLLAAQEDERRRLARELHDEIGAVMTAAKMSVENLARRGAAAGLKTELESTLESVADALQQVRSLSADLRPTMLDDLGLVPALRWYLDKRVRALGRAVHFSSALETDRLPSDVEGVCFRVAQEALTNMLRHSGAKNVWLHVATTNGELYLRIRDDGTGFNLKTSPQGVGISSMRERAMLAGGTLEIHSSATSGTEILLQLPVERPGTSSGAAPALEARSS